MYAATIGHGDDGHVAAFATEPDVESRTCAVDVILADWVNARNRERR